MSRYGSLFARLLAAQVAVAIVLTAMLAMIFYAERHRTVAQLVASRWAPALMLVAQGAPMEKARQIAPGPLQASDQRPGEVFGIASLTPRRSIVSQALIEAGLPVADLVFGRKRDVTAVAPTLWLALRGTDGSVRWVGFESAIVEEALGERVLIATLLLVGLAIAASALIAHRLAQPLEALRARIAADDVSSDPLPHASAEVQAIDEAWRTLRQSLDQQERERALLLAGVSHDLRSPLGRICMAAELLPEGDGIAPKREVIVRNALQADRLVGSFLDYVRSGELCLNETVDVAVVANSVVAQQQRADTELLVAVPPSLMVPHASGVLLERVIGNLLDNAFTHGQPPVRLTVGTVGLRALIEVEDCGSGIAPEDQQAMLQAFARGDTARRHPGLGLGLAVVQRVAIRMRGSVTFSRSPDAARTIARFEWPIG
ncbi:ATP-binding protein [Pseudomonas sp. SG20056]|uniref:sensor histidine kinase n=1 Tax=Pseudomonas sp. SG20056 TaxID=3074146 RepID=UPI00287FBBBE|nr:ATP-binding protein [Pseudomonas sp. SG20056]WNF48161.1 ATP-binding protein [Pseudomonas sp. SG20056]